MPELIKTMNKLVDRFGAEVGERGINNADDAFALVAELVAETGLLAGSPEHTCVAATLNAIAVRNFKPKGASRSI